MKNSQFILGVGSGSCESVGSNTDWHKPCDTGCSAGCDIVGDMRCGVDCGINGVAGDCEIVCEAHWVTDGKGDGVIESNVSCSLGRELDGGVSDGLCNEISDLGCNVVCSAICFVFLSGGVYVTGTEFFRGDLSFWNGEYKSRTWWQISEKKNMFRRGMNERFLGINDFYYAK